jgi:3-hydroxyisobutyrate dehydrogenase-like beta-hydroxyacid dehydrogenase
MIAKRVLAVLHPGAMGAAVAACLVDRGHEVGWLHTGRSEATSRRAAQAGLTPFGDLAELLARSDIVFSICPPHGALVMARELAGFQGIVVDANAISPETSALIGRTVIAGGAGYVDGGIIGPPPTTAGTTRLYLAGDDGEVANLFAGSALNAVSLAGAPPGRIGAEDDVRGLDQDDCGIAGFDPTYRRRLRGGRRPGKRVGD